MSGVFVCLRALNGGPLGFSKRSVSSTIVRGREREGENGGIQVEKLRNIRKETKVDAIDCAFGD